MNTLLSITDFKKAICSFPQSQRLIINQNSIISVEAKEPTSQEVEENKIIVQQLHTALKTSFGEALSNFAFSPGEIEMRILDGSAFTAPAINNIIRKAIIMQQVLEFYAAELPLPKDPSPQECQAYLNAIATYAKQEALAEVQEANQQGVSPGLSVSVTDHLITSLFNATSAEALEVLGKYILSEPTAIATAAAASIGTEAHPISIGAFAITTLIMNSTMTAAVALTATEELK